MHRRTFTTSAAVLAAAVGMSGCFPLVTSQDASQQDVIGDVKVSSKACDIPFLFLSGLPLRSSATKALERGVLADDECPSLELVQEAADDDIPLTVPHQVLAGIRVPAGAKAPETLTATAQYVPYAAFYDDVNDRGAAQPVKPQTAKIMFRKADAYAAQLPSFFAGLEPGEDEAPLEVVGKGQKMTGYVSDVIPGQIVGELQVDGAFGLPEGADPYAGPFNHLTVMGSRWAGSTEEHEEAFFRFFEFVDGGIRNRGTDDEPGFEDVHPDRPIECSSELDLRRADRGLRGAPLDELFMILHSIDYTLCALPPVSEDEDAELAELFEGQDVATRDLRVLGGEAFAEQGQTATVPFKVRSAGAEGGKLTATVATTVPGGAPQAPREFTFPATGEHATPVTVGVPESAAPGTYEVTLTVGSGSASRSAKGSIVVLPKPVVAPLGGQAPRENLFMDSEGNVSFGLVCTTNCGSLQSDVLSMKKGISPTANTAAVSKPRLLRIAKKKSFRTTAGTRTRAKVKLFPKAIKAIRKGRSVKGVLVVRAGGKGVPTVRRVLIRRKK